MLSFIKGGSWVPSVISVIWIRGRWFLCCSWSPVDLLLEVLAVWVASRAQQPKALSPSKLVQGVSGGNPLWKWSFCLSLHLCPQSTCAVQGIQVQCTDVAFFLHEPLQEAPALFHWISHFHICVVIHSYARSSYGIGICTERMFFLLKDYALLT